MSTKRRSSVSSVGSSTRSRRSSVGSVGSRDKDNESRARKLQNKDGQSKNGGGKSDEPCIDLTASEGFVVGDDDKEGSRCSTPASIRKGRASALEFLEGVCNSPASVTGEATTTLESQVPNDETDENMIDADKGNECGNKKLTETNHENENKTGNEDEDAEKMDTEQLEFQVASPSLQRMIDEGSDCSSPVDPKLLDQECGINNTSPLLEVPTSEELPDLDPNPDTVTATDTDKPTTDTESSVTQTVVQTKSPQKARRGRRRRGRFQRRGNNSSRADRAAQQTASGSQPEMASTPLPLPELTSNELVTQDSVSSGTSLPDLPPVLESLEEPPELERMDFEETAPDELPILGTPKRGRFGSPRGRTRAASPRSRGRGSPRAGERANNQSPHGGRRRGAGRPRGKGWTRHKRANRAKSLDSSSIPTESPQKLDDSINEDGPQYEGVSPTGHHNFHTPATSPLIPTTVSTAEEANADSIRNVERRMEEIQSLVSSIQKDCSDTTTTITDSTASGEKKHKRKNWLSNLVSPSKSTSGNLKMTIKFDGAKHGLHRRRGHKRNRYSEDGEYVPRSKRANFEPPPEQPKRSSGRKSEHDLFLDHYRYITDFSGDSSRSPSPVGSVASSVPDSPKCKPCKVQLFDFVKCLNVHDINDLKDLTYNKGIRRQIRALEKGHSVARQKATVTSDMLPNDATSLNSNSEVSVVGDVVASLHEAFQARHTPVLPPEPSQGSGPGKKKKKKKKSKTPELAHSPGASSQSKRRFKCRRCSFVTADLPHIQEHINLHTEPFSCSECKTPFPQMSTAIEHTNTAHPSTPARVIKVANFNANDHFDEVDAQGKVTEIEPTPESAKACFTCKRCSFSTSEFVCIQEHVLLHAEPFHCSVCKLTFSQYSLANEHVISAHPTDSSCRVIKIAFDPNDHFEKVMEPPKSGKACFNCKQCSFSTVELVCIQEHVLLHVEPFHCSVCKTTFTQYSQANEHVISAHPSNTDCRVVKLANFDPNEHFEVVRLSANEIGPGPHPPPVPEEKETNYQCQLCPFRTDDRQQIEGHLQTNHRAEYQYVCRICDLAFCRKKETMLKHFKKWHPDQPLDFTTAPGVEDSSTGGQSAPASATEPSSAPKSPTRPASVISIASEGSPPPASSRSDEIRTITSGENEDVEVIELTNNASTAAPAQEETPSVLCSETRPCTYKCLECGAKTDTFDVICAHLEVSHPQADYAFACPFCTDYKAKTCSFVAEHIRTAHPEFSGRCMERKLEKANLYVKREFTGPPPGVATNKPPARTDSARSSNQENRSPDDEVMILDVATTQASRQPLQPLSLVQHRSQEAPQQPQQQQQPWPQMVQIFSDYAITKSEFDRYQVFNLTPPTSSTSMPRPPAAPPQQRPAPPAPRPSLSQYRPPQAAHRPPQPAHRPQLQRVPPAAPLRQGRPTLTQRARPPQAQMPPQQQMSRQPPRPQLRPQQQPQLRPQQVHMNNTQQRSGQPRPLPPLQPRPFIPSNYYPQMQPQMQMQPQSSAASAPMTNMSISPGASTTMVYPHLMQMMSPPALTPTSMAQPMLYNGVSNPPR